MVGSNGLNTWVCRHLFGLCKNSIWWLSMVLFWLAMVDTASIYNRTMQIAKVDFSYEDPQTHHQNIERDVDGMFGLGSRLEEEKGKVVHVHTSDRQRHGCSPIVNVPGNGKWIALIQRGECKFKQKIYNAAVEANASAVVIYNNKESKVFVGMDHDNVNDVVSVFIHKSDGEKIARLVDSGLEVTMNIRKGLVLSPPEEEKKRNKSLLGISLVLIACLLLGLVLLLVYAVRRQRYLRNKQRPRTLQPVLTMNDVMPSPQANLLSSIPEHSQT